MCFAYCSLLHTQQGCQIFKTTPICIAGCGQSCNRLGTFNQRGQWNAAFSLVLHYSLCVPVSHVIKLVIPAPWDWNTILINQNLLWKGLLGWVHQPPYWITDWTHVHPWKTRIGCRSLDPFAWDKDPKDPLGWPRQHHVAVVQQQPHGEMLSYDYS